MFDRLILLVFLLLDSVLPLVDVLGVFTPRNHIRMSKNDIADLTALPHSPEDAG